MRLLRLFTRSRKRRHRTRHAAAAVPAAAPRRRKGEAHTPRLTQLYLSVPGNRGSDDRILIGGGITLALILVSVGAWFVINAPRSERVTSTGPAQMTSVRFVGMTETNGMADVHFEENGQEFSLSLPSENPIVTEVRKAKPGDRIMVPTSSRPLYDDKPAQRK